MTLTTPSSVVTLNGIVHALTPCHECTGRGYISTTIHWRDNHRRCRACRGNGYIRSEVGRVAPASQPREKVQDLKGLSPQIPAHQEVTKRAHGYRREYESGLTMRQIAAAHGVPLHIVQYGLKAAKCVMRSTGRKLPRKNHWKLLSLIKQGMSLNAAGRAVGVSRERARQIARQHGLSHRMNPIPTP